MPKEMEKRATRLEIRQTQGDAESRTISGYASSFDEDYTLIYDYWGEKFYERVMPGAFAKSLAQRTDQVMLLNHDYDKLVGKRGVNLTLEEDEKGLRFEIDLPNTRDGNDLLEMVRSGLIDGCSFGFYVTDEDVRWDDKNNMYRDIKEVELREITATPFPAYSSTTISENRSINVAELRSKLTDERQDDNINSNTQSDAKFQGNDAGQKESKRAVNILAKFLDGFNHNK